MASLSEIENSSQSQNQDEEVLADKLRMHRHFFVHSQILFAYRIVIGSDRIWGDPIRNPIIPIGSDLIWGDPIREDYRWADPIRSVATLSTMVIELLEKRREGIKTSYWT